MSALDDVVDAIRAADDDGWAVADAIARIPRRGEDGYVTNEGIARYIASKHPAEMSANYVSIMRATADAFPPLTRVKGVSFSAHRILRSAPEKLVDWAKRHPDEPLSATEADKLRPKTAAKTKTPATIGQLADKLLDDLDRLAELEPTLLVEKASAHVADWERRYAKRIEKVRRGLAVVS